MAVVDENGYRTNLHACEWEDASHTVRKIRELDTDHLKAIIYRLAEGDDWCKQRENQRRAILRELRRRGYRVFVDNVRRRL